MAGRPPAGAARRQTPAQPTQPPQIEPFVPVADKHNRNPRELKSWARRTGFRPFSGVFSGESSATTAFSGEAPPPPPPPPHPEIDGDHGRRRRRERGEVAQRRVPPLAATGRSAAAATVAAVVEDEDGKREEEQLVDLEKGGEERGRRRRRMFGLGLRREEREESLDRELAAAVNGMRDGSVETPNGGRDAETRNKEEEEKAMERKEEEEEKKKKAMERNEEEMKEPRDEEIDMFWEEDNGSRGRSGGGAQARDGNRPPTPTDLRCGITENPGWGKLISLILSQQCI